MATIEQSSTRVASVESSYRWQAIHSVEKRRFGNLLNFAEALWDGLVSAAAVAGSVYCYRMLHLGRQIHYSPKTIALAALASGALFVLMLDHEGAYCIGNSLLRIRETERVLRVTAYAGFLMLPIFYLAGQPIPRWILILALFAVAASLTAAKQVFYGFSQALRARGVGVRNVVIYGTGYSGRRVYSALARSPKLGLLPVAIVDDDIGAAGREVFGLGYRREPPLRVHRGPIRESLLRDFRADLLIIAIPDISAESFRTALRAARDAGVAVAYLPHRNPEPDQAIDYLDVDGLFLASPRKIPAYVGYDPFKKIFDAVVSLLILVVLSPLFAALALWVRIDSPGPAFFVQERIGKGGRRFRMFKFRSMYVDTPMYACSPVRGTDSRITRIGRFLRKSSLDELPQLLNVLRGEMSLVGPRPEMPFVVQRYTPSQWQRLGVTPGMTGLWQLSADRAFPIHENIQYDFYYIRNRGFFMDIAILLHTLAFAIKGV